MSEVARAKPARRWRRRLLFGAIVLPAFAAALFALLPSILSSGAARARIEAALGSRVGAPVRLGSLRLSWFGSQEVRGLRVGALAGGEDLLDAPRVVLSSGLVRLLCSGAEGLRVEIERPTLNLYRDAEGRFNFGGVGAGPQAGGARREGGASPASEPCALPEIALAVRGGTVRYRDDLLRRASDVADVDALVSLGGASGRLEARGKIVPAGGSGGSFEVSADFGRAAGLEIRGTLDAGFARLEGLAAKVPSGEGGASANLAMPYSVELGTALEVLGVSEGGGSPVRGALAGKLSATVPISMADLGSGDFAGKRFEIRLEGEASGLEVVLPRVASGDRPAGGAARSDANAPRTCFQKKLSLALAGSVDPAAGAVEIERLALAGDGVAADAKATLRPAPAEAGGAGAERRFELELRSLEAADPELAAWIQDLLPEGCELERVPTLRVAGLRLAGALASGASVLGTLEGQGSVAVAGALRYRGISAADLEAAVRLRGGAVEFQDLRSSVNGGKVVADVLSVGLETPPAYRLSLRADGVAASYDMAPLLAYALPFLTPGVDGAEFSGTIRGAIAIEGRGFSFADLETNLRGRGSLRVLGGAISASGLFAELSNLLRREFGRTLFEEAGSDFEIGDGKVASKGVFLRGREGGKLRSLRLRGATSFGGKLDYGIELSAIRDAIGDKEARKILEIAEGVLGGDVVPLRLAGTLSKPRISLGRGLRDFFEGLEKRLK